MRILSQGCALFNFSYFSIKEQKTRSRTAPVDISTSQCYSDFRSFRVGNRGSWLSQRSETFIVLIAKISRNIRKIKNQEMAEYNLQSAHISCLCYLYCTSGLTATDLCGRCEEDKATTSRALASLEERAYIFCPSESDKRYKPPFPYRKRCLRLQGDCR